MPREHTMHAATGSRGPDDEAAREDFYRRIDRLAMTPLWSVLGALITPTPASACQPWLWRYDELRPYLLEAGALISAREADRRGLGAANPRQGGPRRANPSPHA